MKRLACACWFALLACGGVRAAGDAPASGPSLWVYVDGAGIAHFASSRIDGRYAPVMADTPGGAGRVPGKADNHTALLTWLDIAPQARSVQPLVRHAAREHGVDAELLNALIAVESAFDARAVSPRGAIGLMQITPVTADRYATRAEAQRPAAERLLDARTNIQTGARMLADLNRRFGRLDLALAAWNAGEGTVRKHGGAMPPIDETRAHVQQVLELYWALLQQRQARVATGMRMVENR
jgi:soluble lytic murein transglycosylase-like protein